MPNADNLLGSISSLVKCVEIYVPELTAVGQGSQTYNLDQISRVPSSALGSWANADAVSGLVLLRHACYKMTAQEYAEILAVGLRHSFIPAVNLVISAPTCFPRTRISLGRRPAITVAKLEHFGKAEGRPLLLHINGASLSRQPTAIAAHGNLITGVSAADDVRGSAVSRRRTAAFDGDEVFPNEARFRKLKRSARATSERQRVSAYPPRCRFEIRDVLHRGMTKRWNFPSVVSVLKEFKVNVKPLTAAPTLGEYQKQITIAKHQRYFQSIWCHRRSVLENVKQSIPVVSSRAHIKNRETSQCGTRVDGFYGYEGIKRITVV
ncbi:hypothetical protein FB451DRAFT_1173598 [Mycena latifolia]|nr:hypothetical protein FB451DRAFT_1173598 [Mycena latifolia]